MDFSELNPKRKVVVIGAGSVGATFCYALAQSGLADEIVLIDHNKDLARGQVLDLAHGQSFFPPVTIRVGDQQDYADATLLVMTAGARQQPGETRLQLLRRNASIVRQVARDIALANSPGMLVIVSNPVDILTKVAAEETGWRRGRVLGSGTVLDSARFRSLLSHNCGIDIHNIHAYILGEHGDSEFAAWSMTHVAGIPIDEYCTSCRMCTPTGKQDEWLGVRKSIEEQVRNSAYHIIDYKGSTYFAIGLALVRIAGAILRNENSVLTVSTLLEGEYGVSGLCLSVPAVVSGRGVERIMEARLNPEEQKALARSAAVLRASLNELEGNE
ncbi:MAG TPA: L-lactate dehydrogenase [Candidatus Hydrogenedentes bacterium]|jgi:L-lactate dehydrogenase|nr:L-lactate dehydrogenase [Candidatus Hydrogenedentota bacterium]HOD96498.1 L-lactate dehydrogenase [Candidatus Hydrogenedentota bacterium]HOM48891.1 L-lactate dehydrogenase [Candidatus Hydrogenedentota bacterium]HOR51674.1 L-lactate dehydrogenase [Candidatus Hydrogenedentota bacterium]HPK25870.1 L-lactate dehydrogenase [Candidatus Hydrogenedentota bacterium]